MSLRKLTVDVGYRISTSPLETLDKRLNKLSGTNANVFNRMESSMGKAGKAMQDVSRKSSAMVAAVAKSQRVTEQATQATDKAVAAKERLGKAENRLQKASDAAAKATERAKMATAKAAEVAVSSASSQEKVTKAIQRVQCAHEKAAAAAVRAQKADEKFRIAQEQAAAAGHRVRQASHSVTQAVERQSKAAQRAAKEMDKLRKKYGDFSTGSLKVLEQIDRASGNLQSAGVTMGAAGGILTAGIGSSIKLAADFESAVSRVGALSGATSKDIQRLTDTAKQLGAKTVFTSSQVAEGMQYLSMAGFKTNDMIAAMPGLLHTAAAGQIDLGRAADLTSNILTGFGIAATDTTKVADILTATFTNANTDLNLLGDTMKYIAPIAKASGRSLEEMAAATALLGNAGIQGSEAGTALRATMIRLAKPPKEAADVLEQLGVSMADQRGKVLPLSNIIGQFTQKTKGLTDAQRLSAVSTVVGTEAASAFLALMDAGQPALERFRTTLEKSGGVAKKIANKQLHNLNGAMEKVNSAMEGAKLSIGETFIPILTQAATGINWLVDRFNALPEGVKQGIALFVAISGAILLVGGALTLLVSFIPNVVAGFKMLSMIRPILLGLSGPMLAVIAVVAAVAASVYLIIKHWKPIAAFFQRVGETIRSSLARIVNGVRMSGEAIKSMTSRIWDAIVERIKRAMGWIKNLPAHMVQMGKEAITGFVDGLKGAAHSVGHAVSDLASKVTNGIKDALDIRSPSRVMKQLGQCTSEGFQIGIQDNIPEITHAVKGLAEAAVTPREQPKPQGFAPTYNHSSANRSIIVSPNIEIRMEMKGTETTKAAKDVAREVKKEMEQLFRSFGMKNPPFIEG